MTYLEPDGSWIADELRLFGRAIRKARLAAGLTQAGLGDRCSIDQPTISRLERGRIARFPFDRMLRLASALDRLMSLGACPHPHECRWQDRETYRERVSRLETAPGDGWGAPLIEGL